MFHIVVPGFIEFDFNLVLCITPILILAALWLLLRFNAMRSNSTPKKTEASGHGGGGGEHGEGH